MSTITDAMLATGFENGERFEDEAQVRQYFTVANLAYMFDADADIPTQAELDEMAETVIETREHCAF